MPDVEVGHILTQFYGQAMASNPPLRHQLPSHENSPAQYRSQFRSSYQTEPSPAFTTTPGSSQNHTGYANQYSTSNSRNPSQQPSVYVSDTPDAFPSPDHAQIESGSGSVAAAAGQPKRTRTRPTKSCERCRSKKLRCDREFPCGSCKKGEKSGNDCSYRDGWEPEEKEEARVAKRPRAGAGGGGNLGVVEKMVRIGEAMGSVRSPQYLSSTRGGNPLDERLDSATQYSLTPAASTSSTTLGRLDIKGQRSRYVAPGDKMSIMAHFEEPKKFITCGFKDPAMVGIMQELSGFQKAMLPKRAKIDPRITTPKDRGFLMAEMFQAVPDGFLLEALQTRLFLNWETIQRVLHIATFSKECEAVTTAQSSGASTSPTHLGDWVVPQILAATAIVSRLDDPTLKHSTIGRMTEGQITRNIHLTKVWLDGLSGKANICLHTLRTRTLLLLAQQVNLASTQDLWMDSAALVRWAMSMGLHQDAELYPDMSKLDKEMRRKLWTTIVELDMQFSLAAGMPASVTSSTFKLRDLVSVDDSELTATMIEYPKSRSDTVWTDAMPQVALAASLKDRLNITNLLGGHLNLERDGPALLSHASILEKALRSLPQQFRGMAVSTNVNNKRIERLFASLMLDMSIRRPLLALYRTVVFSQQSVNYPEARRGALRCALVMLSHLDALDPTIADMSIVKSRDYLNLFHILYKNDIVQAALLVCHGIRSFNNASASDTGLSDAIQPEDSLPHTKHSLTRVVENTLNSLLSRLGDFGCDLKDILLLSVVLQSVRAEGTAEEMREVMQRGAERVVLACRRALPGVQPLNMDKKSATPTAGDSWNSVVLQNGGQAPMNDFNMIPIDDFDFQNIDFGWGDWGVGQSWV